MIVKALDVEQFQEVDGGVPPVPWMVRPYQLVSWWNMQKFAAEEFMNIATILATQSARLLGLKGVYLDQASCHNLAGDLNYVAAQCRIIGLKVAARQFESAALGLGVQINTTQASQLLLCLNQAIVSEMSENLFLRVFPDRVDFYEQIEGFGSKVSDAFPSAERDIKESGSCYAADRNTACVMHLMRILEVGLGVLATNLGVSYERRNWENVINDIEAAIKKINGPHAGSDWKDKERFYSETAKDLRYFKNAWRNHAMHYREHYETSEARSIWNHVQAFMAQLAEGGLKE